MHISKFNILDSCQAHTGSIRDKSERQQKKKNLQLASFCSLNSEMPVTWQSLSSQLLVRAPYKYLLAVLFLNQKSCWGNSHSQFSIWDCIFLPKCNVHWESHHFYSEEILNHTMKPPNMLHYAFCQIYCRPSSDQDSWPHKCCQPLACELPFVTSYLIQSLSPWVHRVASNDHPTPYRHPRLFLSHDIHSPQWQLIECNKVISPLFNGTERNPVVDTSSCMGFVENAYFSKHIGAQCTLD